MVKTTDFNVQTQMNYVVGNMSGFTAAYTGMDNLSALVSSLMTSYTTLAGTGRAAYASIGAAVAAVGLKSAEAFGEYQRGMNIVKAISNNTNAQMQMLAQTANQFSSQFRMDISDINDGLVTLGRAGLTDVNNQIQVLQNGLQVAKLEGMNLAAALEDIVTTTSLLGGDVSRNDFGAQSSKVSNLLVATSLSGPLDVGDVIETLKFAGGSAAAAGANLNNEEGLKDLLGTIGAFSQKGVIGSIAGTALRAFITKPASQDKTVKDALAELGLDAYSLWEKDEKNGWQMKPIAEQIGLITDAMDKQHMTNLDRIEVWGDIVGNKMGQQMLKLDENKIKDVTKDIEHQRSLEEIYQGTLTNFASQVERLNQVFQSIYRNIGSGFATSLTGIVQGLADVFEFLNSIGNGVLFKMVAPILGPLGLAGLAKGLQDVVQLLGALRANIKSSAERPIKGQPLYQPYEDWITGGKKNKSTGVIESSGAISISGPTTIQNTGNMTSYKDFMKNLSNKYNEDYRNTPQWRAMEEQARMGLSNSVKTMGYTRPGNVLSKGTAYDITMKDPTKFSEKDLANLQKYESNKMAVQYLGDKLLESGQLLTRDFHLTDEALNTFRKAMGLSEESMPTLRRYANKAFLQMNRDYTDTSAVDPTDPKGERINPEFANKMVEIVSKRALSAMFRADYLEELGPNANFFEFIKKGVNATGFAEYLKIPIENFKKEAEAKGWKKGSDEYDIGYKKALANQASMANLGAFTYLNTTEQNNNVSQLALQAVNRGLAGFTLKGGVDSKVKEELNRTKQSIEADAVLFEKAGVNLGGSLKEGYLGIGLGIHSPGYMYWYTVEELERIERFLLQSASILEADGKIAGSSIVKAFESQPWITKGINSNERYLPNELIPQKSKGNFLVLDTETTGTDFHHTDLNKNSGILQIGAAMFDMDKEEMMDPAKWAYKTGGLDPEDYGKKNAVVRYRMNDHKVENIIEPEAGRVSKIDYDNFKKGQFLSEEQELKNFANYIEKVLGKSIRTAIELGEKIKVVAHNGEFDINALSKTIERVNMELSAAGRKTIPDFTKVFDLVDTMKVGRQALQDVYGTQPIKKLGADGSLSLGIRYMQSFDGGPEEMHFMGNETQESYGRLTGVAKKEMHDAFMDAYQAGKIYIKLENRNLPRGLLGYGPTFYDPKETPLMYGLEYSQAITEAQLQDKGGSHVRDIRTFKALQAQLHAQETSNYYDLVKSDLDEARRLTGPGAADEHAFRFYGPYEENLKEIRKLEEQFGPGLGGTIPRPDKAPIGKGINYFTPFSFINNFSDKLGYVFDIQREIVQKGEAVLDYAAKAQKGPTSGEKVKGKQNQPIGSALLPFGVPNDESYGSAFIDEKINESMLLQNLHAARYQEFETLHKIYAQDFNDLVNFVNGKSFYHGSTPKEVRDDGTYWWSQIGVDPKKLKNTGYTENIHKLTYEQTASYILEKIPRIFGSGLFNLLDIQNVLPGISTAQDAYGKLHVAPTGTFYQDGVLKEGFSTPQKVSAQRALTLMAQGFDELGILIKPLQNWLRNAGSVLTNTYASKQLPNALGDVSPQIVHQALMKLFNPTQGDLGQINELKNKFLYDNKEKTYTEKFTDLDVQKIIQGLGKFNKFGEFIGLNSLGEEFLKDHGLGKDKVINLHDLTNMVTNLLHKGELSSKYMPRKLAPQENNVRGNNREDEVDYYIEDRFTKRDKDNKLVNDVIGGKFAHLATVPQMVDFVNQSSGFDIWNIKNDRLSLTDFSYDYMDLQKVESSLLLMEELFKTNTPGAYYNYKDVHPMDSMKTIEDLPMYKRYMQLYKRMSGGLDWHVDPELQYNKVKAKIAGYYKKDIEEGYFEKGKNGKYERVKEGGRIWEMMNKAAYSYHDPNITSEEKRWSREDAQRRAFNIYDPKFVNGNPLPAFVSQLKDLPDGIEKYIPVVQRLAKLLGEGFVENFRDGVGFHSPIEVINEFNETLKDQLNETGVITKESAEKIKLAAEEIPKAINTALSKVKTDEEIAALRAQLLIPLSNAQKNLVGVKNQPDKEIKKILNTAYGVLSTAHGETKNSVVQYGQKQVFNPNFLSDKDLASLVDEDRKFQEKIKEKENKPVKISQPQQNQSEKAVMAAQAKAQKEYEKSAKGQWDKMTAGVPGSDELMRVAQAVTKYEKIKNLNKDKRYKDIPPNMRDYIRTYATEEEADKINSEYAQRAKRRNQMSQIKERHQYEHDQLHNARIQMAEETNKRKAEIRKKEAEEEKKARIIKERNRQFAKPYIDYYMEQETIAEKIEREKKEREAEKKEREAKRYARAQRKKDRANPKYIEQAWNSFNRYAELQSLPYNLRHKVYKDNQGYFDYYESLEQERKELEKKLPQAKVVKPQKPKVDNQEAYKLAYMEYYNPQEARKIMEEKKRMVEEEEKIAKRVQNISKLANRPKQGPQYDIYGAMRSVPKRRNLDYGHLTAEEFLKRKKEASIIKNLDKSTPLDLGLLSDKKSLSSRLRDAYGFKKSSKKKSSEEKLQERNRRALNKWTSDLIKGHITQEQYHSLQQGLLMSGTNFNAAIQQSKSKITEYNAELTKLDSSEQEKRTELVNKINQEIEAIMNATRAQQMEATASTAAANADMQESRAGRIKSMLSGAGQALSGLPNKLFGFMMHPAIMVGQMIWGYIQQGIEMVKQQEQEKISKLSEIVSNADSAYDDQQSKWEEAQAKEDESFNELSDNEKQDKMLEAISAAREDLNKNGYIDTDPATKALIGKQNEALRANNNLIKEKSSQGLTGYDGLQAGWEEFMNGSGMVGDKDEYGLLDRLEGLVNPEKYRDDSNTRRLEALQTSLIQIDTRVKNMEEFTEDYQQVMASFGISNKSLLDIYNVRGIADLDNPNFLQGTFFDKSSNVGMGKGGMTAEQMALYMKKQEKILTRFENRFIRFVRKGNKITADLSNADIHTLAKQMGVSDLAAAQMTAVHMLQRIQDVMINQITPQLTEQAIGIYQGNYTLTQTDQKETAQTALQKSLDAGIWAIQTQVAQLVYQSTMEQALSDYQAATGDTETDTIGLLLNRARDSSYQYHDIAQKYAAQGLGSFTETSKINEYINAHPGATQEEAINALSKGLVDKNGNGLFDELGEKYKQAEIEKLNKYQYNSTADWISKNAGWIGGVAGGGIGAAAGFFGGAGVGAVPGWAVGSALGTGAGVALGNLIGGAMGSTMQDTYEGWTNYTNEKMRDFALNVPIDSSIETLNDYMENAESEGDNGKDKTDDSDANKQRYVQLAICNKKAIPKLNVNLFKKAPTFTVLNKNFKLRDIKINTADKAKNIENSLKNAIIDVQERSDPKIIQDSEAEYDPVGATDDATNLPTGASLTK